MKYCINCKFYDHGGRLNKDLGMCKHPRVNYRFSMVSGEIENIASSCCSIMRGHGKIKSYIFNLCGKEGRLFEEKKDE